MFALHVHKLQNFIVLVTFLSATLKRGGGGCFGAVLTLYHEHTAGCTNTHTVKALSCNQLVVRTNFGVSKQQAISYKSIPKQNLYPPPPPPPPF